MIKLIVSVFLLVGLSLNVYATPQIPDILIYEGKEYPIQWNFLEDYFKRHPERNPKVESESCSALWRGYRSTYVVVSGAIYLKDVFTNACFGTPTSQLNKVIPGGGKLAVDWVTGLIDSGYGRNDEDPYRLESLDAYEKYSFFEVEKGRVLEVRHFDNKGYQAFKKKQFEAYRKTPGYEVSVKRMLTDNPRMTREDVDSNIHLWIFSYTNKFLVPTESKTQRRF